MFTTLIPAIKAVLDTLTGAGQPFTSIYDRPLAKDETIEAYPAVVFYPVAVTNEFMTNVENSKQYDFKVFVMTEVEVAGIATAFNTILAGAVDDVIQKFDDEWDGGVVSGHRVWYRLESGDWYLTQEQNGLLATAELNLQIKLATNNA